LQAEKRKLEGRIEDILRLLKAEEGAIVAALCFMEFEESLNFLFLLHLLSLSLLL
jgi:hypothetical protein